MNKYKKLMSNTLVFAVGQLGAKLLSFFLVKLYTAVLTDAEFSTADLLYQTVNVLVPVVTMSMSDAIIRFGLEKGRDRRRVYSGAVFMTTLGMTVFALTTPIWNSIPIYHGYTFLLYMYCYFSVFRQLASQFTRAEGRVKLFAFDGVLATLTQFLCNLVLMAGFKLGITGYVLSFILSDAISLIFLTAMGRLDRSLDTKFIDKELIKEMLRYSIPLVPTYLLWWITSASDRLFVIDMVGPAENGVYAFANKIPTLLMLVTTMFYQAWQMSSIEEKDSDSLGNFYKTVYGVYSSLIFVAAAGLIMIVKPMNRLLMGSDEFAAAENFTPILIIAMVFQCLCQFLSSIYSVNKKSVNSCITAFVAAAVNILLNFLLIPRYGVYGAAIATAASYFACFAVRIVDTRRYIKFKVDYLRTILNTAICIGMCTISIKKPSMYILWVILCFCAAAVINLGAILKTLKRLLNRGKKAE